MKVAHMTLVPVPSDPMRAKIEASGRLPANKSSKRGTLDPLPELLLPSVKSKADAPYSDKTETELFEVTYYDSPLGDLILKRF